MEGNGILTCTSESIYDFPAPICVPVHCKKPLINQNSSIVQQKGTYVYGNSIEFQCDIGHEMKGLFFIEPIIIENNLSTIVKKYFTFFRYLNSKLEISRCIISLKHLFLLK